MTDEQWQAHLNRMDTHMARQSVLMEQIGQGIELTRREVEFSRQGRDDLRQVIRDQNTRMDRAFDRLASHLDDMGDQIRANTRAVLLAVDRLQDGGSAA